MPSLLSRRIKLAANETAPSVSATAAPASTGLKTSFTPSKTTLPQALPSTVGRTPWEPRNVSGFQRVATGSTPRQLEDFNSHLHGIGATSARGQLGGAARAQGYPQVTPAQTSSVGNAMLRSRFPGQGLQGVNMTFEPGGSYALGRLSPRINIDQRQYLGGAPIDGSTALNHELSHTYQNPPRNTLPTETFMAETGPSLGDIVFSGERINRETGVPLKHTVAFPAGKTHDLQWMIRQAQRHGYFDGRSMDDLLNTPEGAAWLRQAVQGMGPMQKKGSTALTRRIAAGVLSPKTIQRAASTMAPGKFRFVGNLGRGQFSVADKVVGNFGNHAGLAVRKLPTTQVSPVQEYGPVAALTGAINERYAPSILQRAAARMRGRQAAPPLAPYVAVNERGGFQQVADGYVPWHNARLKRSLGDLHKDNMGPGGQILDFGVSPQLGTLPHTPGMTTPPSLHEMYKRPRIASAPTPNGQDMLGNIQAHAPELQQALRPMVNQTNEQVRRYWSLPAEQRSTYLTELQRRQPELSVDAMRAFHNFGPTPVRTPTTPPAGTWSYHSGQPPQPPTPPKPSPIGMWTDFRYDPKPYLTVGGLGAAAAGSAGYGLYNWLNGRN